MTHFTTTCIQVRSFNKIHLFIFLSQFLRSCHNICNCENWNPVTGCIHPMFYLTNYGVPHVGWGTVIITRRKTSAWWGEREREREREGGRERETECSKGEGLQGGWRAESGDWGSAGYSKLTQSHRTQVPIRVTATLIKPDLQPLAAGRVWTCTSVLYSHMNPRILKYSHTVLSISHWANSRWFSLCHVKGNSSSQRKGLVQSQMGISRSCCCLMKNKHLADCIFLYLSLQQCYACQS